MAPSSLTSTPGSSRPPERFEESRRLHTNDPGNPPAPSIDRNPRRPSAVASNDDRVFGVQSLSGIASEMNTSVPREDADKISGQHGEEIRDNIEEQSLRRRSTLRPSLSLHEIISHTNESSPHSRGDSGLAQPGNIRLYASPSVAPSSTSISLDSQDLSSSLSSSPKSRSSRLFRRSNEELHDGSESQAVVSSEDDEPDASLDVEDSVPQLIMPSIKMPSRRPFTQQGKAMGRLKIMIAGGKGVGKTSLIKSIVQLSEDIVHVDTFPSSPPCPDQTRPKSRGKRTQSIRRLNVHIPATSPEARVSEIFASTKPYPHWWSELDEGKLLPRRKSMGDTILERNLCFVDVSGEGDPENMADISARYIVTQLSKTFSFSEATENDLVSLMGGTGGSQVDLVFYLVTPSVTEGDVSAIKRLAEMTNVVALLAKSDLFVPSDIPHTKETLKRHLALRSIECFHFPVHPEGKTPSPSLPYAVCSALSSDTETMDASLLMSPDYVQPIQHSDLGYLLSLVFDPINMEKLRHTAATRLIRCRREAVLSHHAPQNSLMLDGPLIRNQPSYLQARIAAHTAREETLAQARLAKWATDLQRGLAHERARYRALAGLDRKRWLEEQVNSAHSTSPAAPSSPSAQGERARGGDTKRRPTWSRSSRGVRINVEDPLGLIRFKERAKKHAWSVLRWMSAGALAGLVVWGYKTWDFDWVCGVWDGSRLMGA